MKKVSSLLILLSFYGAGFAQYTLNRLSVVDPGSGLWSDGVPAHFQNIKMQVQPMNAFANVVVQMELTAQYSAYAKRTDQLEFVYRFKLPKGAVMHEAWLWMEGVAVEAKLYERGEAKIIYESYVTRRTDPLIIYKDGDIYEARIFPVLNPHPRKIQFSMVIPAKITSTSTSITLPMDIFGQEDTSKLANIDIMIDKSSNWGMPALFEEIAWSLDGNFLEFNLSNKVSNHLEFANLIFPYAKVDDGFYTTTNPKLQESFFQVVLKDDLTVKHQGNNYLFVMDYDSKGSTPVMPNWRQMLKSHLLENLNSSDSFNIMFTSNKQIRTLKSEWICADSLRINQYLNHLSPIVMDNEAIGCADLLKAAVKFVNDHGKKGNLWVLTFDPTINS